MAEPATLPQPEATIIADDGCVHIACEHDPYTVLCGKPTSPDEEVLDAPDCPDCLDIEALYDLLGIYCEHDIGG